VEAVRDKWWSHLSLTQTGRDKSQISRKSEKTSVGLKIDKWSKSRRLIHVSKDLGKNK
jgi:hypothetical protein